jgi:hypothetical protein
LVLLQYSPAPALPLLVVSRLLSIILVIRCRGTVSSYATARRLGFAFTLSFFFLQRLLLARFRPLLLFLFLLPSMPRWLRFSNLGLGCM